MRVRWLLILATSSCSFLVARVPAPRQDGTVDCRMSTLSTIGDVAVTLGAGIPGAVEEAQTPGARAVALIALAVPFAASAVYGAATRVRCGRVRAASARELAKLRGDDSAAAWKLAKQGEVAARNHDCATAKKLAERIRKLDAATYDTEYARDPAVVACLAK
jgi:hypothetical protein